MEYRTLDKWPAGEEVSLQGYIDTDYDTLVKMFGDPNCDDGDKIDAQWLVQFEDGTFATIYNYENGVNYLGTRGLSVALIRDWHIGGHDKTAVDRVHELFAIAQATAHQN